VIGTAHDVADARTHRTTVALQAAGLSVEVFGRGAAQAGPTGAQIHILRPRGLVGRLLDAGRVPLRARGRVLLVIDPDPLLGATLRRWTRGNPFVADCHEDYSALLADRAWAHGWKGAAARRLTRLTTRLAARADLTTVADDHVPPLTARERLVVRNVPSGEYLPQPSEPDPVPRALYIGDVRQSRGLRTMLAALEAAPSWELDIVGPVSELDRDWLQTWLETSSAATRVTFHGRMPPAQAWLLARGAWVGLCLLDLTPAFVEAMPSKVYEYLGCGLPVLVTALPKAAELVGVVGAGHVVTDAESTAAARRADEQDLDRFGAERAAAASWADRRAMDASPYAELAERAAALVAQTKTARR